MTTEMLSAARTASPSDVLAAIKSASRETGSDFGYLLSIAQRESNLDNTAKSKSSSATGLFQFIDQTWLSLIKRYGTEHGLGHHADAISRTDSGRFVVGSPEAKSAILALREDPKISALMAGEAAAATKQSLECALSRAVCSGELYAAHFLGEGGARRLIGLNEQNAGAQADLAFPEAAKANRNVFYHADGRAKTIGEVHAWAVGEPPETPAPTQRARMVASSDAPRVSRSMPDATTATRISSNDSEDSFGITIRGSRFAFTGVPEASPTEAVTFPRSPLALSSGLLDIFAAAFAAPSVTRRQA
jgi:hypothetical protein